MQASIGALVVVSRQNNQGYGSILALAIEDYSEKLHKGELRHLLFPSVSKLNGSD